MTRRGFTFIEILATLTLLAAVLPVAMAGISASLGAADYAKHQSRACALAQSKLMELLAQNQWQMGRQSGDFGTDWPGFSWTAQVVDWDGSSIQQLDVTVLWHQGPANRERSVAVSTLVRTQP